MSVPSSDHTLPAEPVIRRFLVSELSMSPALRPGDRLAARRLRRPLRGRIVFFPHPDRPGFWLVKRIVAVGGERVSIRGGVVLVDDTPLDEPWTTDATEPEGAWFVPRDRVFVLSDARHRSRADSRSFGPVEVGPMFTPLRRPDRTG